MTNHVATGLCHENEYQPVSVPDDDSVYQD
jgi:hypothetical protein